jgi:hypothetical protein
MTFLFRRSLSLASCALPLVLGVLGAPGRLALADDPFWIGTGEMSAKLKACLDEKKQLELCDPRELDGTKKPRGGLWRKRAQENVNHAWEHAKIDGLKGGLHVNIPINAHPSWYVEIGTRIRGAILPKSEILIDPVRAKEQESLEAAGRKGVWLQHSFELAPRIKAGLHPKKLFGVSLRDFLSSVIPEYHWNAYMVRWHELGDLTPEGPKPKGLKNIIGVYKKIGIETPAKYRNAISVYSAPAESLERDFLPGETIELERFGDLTVAVGPVGQATLLSALSPLTLGGALGFGWSFSKDFAYYRCGIEMLGGTQLEVDFQKLSGARHGPFAVLGPWLELSFLHVGYPLALADFSWMKLEDHTRQFIVDTSKPGVSEAIADAYRKGHPEALLELARLAEAEGGDTGVRLALEDERISHGRGKSLGFPFLGEASSTVHTDLTRTRLEAGGQAMKVRAVIDESERNRIGPRSGKSLRIAVRSDPVNPEAHSIRASLLFDTTKPLPDERLELYQLAHALVPPGDAENQARIREELERARDGQARGKLHANIHVELDAIAMTAMLGPGRDTEFIDRWLDAYAPGLERPLGWESMGYAERYGWINSVAAQGDAKMRVHLVNAGKFLESAAEAKELAHKPIKLAEHLLNKVRGIGDLYPLSAMLRMPATAGHVFAYVLLAAASGSDEEEDPEPVSFMQYGESFMIPLTPVRTNRD